ncbi:MAG: endonuclease domain-containing protein [bacterium]|nr:endonuclease domain-containing protein [bacterium]
MTRKPPLPKERRERSRELRSAPTEAEKKLWEHLRRKQLGVHFRRQHPVGPFVLDFYCHEAKLAVELDGGGHAEAGQAAHDAGRSRALADEGIRVLRFWNSDVMGNIEGVLGAIQNALNEGGKTS